jgi:uncharacterized membrane protein YcjF (UPF0283 family)
MAIMFRDLWKLVTRVTLILGAAISFIIVLELMRGFAFFYRFSPTAGWTYAAVLAVGAIGGCIYLLRVWASYPRVLEPPPLPEPEHASHLEMRRYVEYLSHYLARLSRNPNLEEAQSQSALQQADELREVLGAHPLNEDLRRAIERTEADVVAPLLQHLEDLANQEIRKSVRDVMLGVTLSPYHSVDLVVVVYRNAAMTLRIAGIYRSRPGTPEQLRILRDVLRVVVTVNFLYIGRNLLENLFANIPFVGRVVDDIGQGLGAGLFTSAAGHAALERCAAYRGWSRRAAEDSLASQTKAFLVDVRDLFTRDVLPALRGKLRAEVPTELVNEPGFWDRLSAGIGSAVDLTGNLLSTLVIQPAVAGTRGVLRVGASLTQTTANAGLRMRRSSSRRRHHRHRTPAFVRALETFTQRVKYTFKGPPPA